MKALQIVQQFFPKVTSIVDATKPAAIEVTKRDAASLGVKKHRECAMAVACKRKFHLDGVIISRTTAYLVKGKRARRFQLPPSVSREVVSYDRGAGFAPGKYSLSPVTEANRIGHTHSGASGKKTSGAPSKFRHLTANIRHVLGGQEPSKA